MSTIRIYTDLEYMHPHMSKEYGRPTSKDKRQILQIAAIKWDTVTGKEVEAFSQLVLPLPNSPIPPFFTELTGITEQQILDEGISFPPALQKFTAFCGKLEIWTFMADFEVWLQNCEYYNIPFPYRDRPFTRVRPLLPQWNVDPETVSSGTVAQAVGIKMQGHVHNALHDVRSMAAAVHVLERKFSTQT